jgi:DNA-binding transcriptional MocR family regulator
MEHWTPTLDQAGGTLHQRLLGAIRNGIAAGTLPPGAQLPPQRALANRMGIGIGTVTRAYTEAERLGLLTSTVGRGTFVAQPETVDEPSPDSPVDLSVNIQWLHPAAHFLPKAFERLQKQADARALLDFSPQAGFPAHRQALSEWLKHQSHFQGLNWQRLAIVTGAQQAMSLTVDELCVRGEVVLTEPAAFSGFLAIAAWKGVRCEAVAMDEFGMIPEALDEAVGRFHSRVLYLQPTLHNPTTRTMPMSRRDAIVAVARKHDLAIIEDDVYSALGLRSRRGPRDIVPIATLAPERTWYCGSVSKSIGPGLRVGVIVVPDDRDMERLALGIRAQFYATNAIAPAIVTGWIHDGTAELILDHVADEARQRLRLAERMLGRAAETPSLDTSLKIWLPMPELAAERVANTALRRGIVLTPPQSMTVDGSLVSGLRVCLNTVSRPRLEHGLRILSAVLADTHAQRHATV